MLAYLAGAIEFLMRAPLLMAPWIMFTTMLYLLQKRAHRFRRHGTLRLFATSIIIAVAIPLTTTLLAWVFDRFLQQPTRMFVFLGMGPVLVVLVFALTVTLIQRFMGADAETALALSWPIVAITYVVPLAICFILSLFHIPWLTGQQEYP
jgi:chromate transport protein ChrA